MKYDFLEAFRFDYEYDFSETLEFNCKYDFLETFRFDYEYEFEVKYDFLRGL